MNWVFRFDPLLFGVFTYYLYNLIGKSFFNNLFKANNVICSLTSCLLLLSLSAVLPAFSAYGNFKITISSLVAMFMMILALSENGYFYSRYRYFSLMIDYISSRSYALFCTHILVWCIVKYIYLTFQLNTNTLFFSAILAMFIASEFSYRYIENILLKK